MESKTSKCKHGFLIGRPLFFLLVGIGTLLFLCDSCASPDAVYAKETVLSETISVQENTLVREGPVRLNREELQYPDRILTENQVEHRLISAELTEVPVEGTLTYVSASVSYELEGSQEPPETAEITFWDERSGSEYKRELSCMEVKEKEIIWVETFSFPVTISGYDADSFRLGDIEISREEDLAEHGKELLESIGLSSDYYRVEAVEWVDESYEKDGTVFRDALATGEKKIRRVEVEYGGQIRTPDTVGYQYVSVYEPVFTEESDQIGKSDMKHEQESGSEQFVMDDQINFLDRVYKVVQEHLTVVTVSIFFVLCFVGGIGLLISRKPKSRD